MVCSVCGLPVEAEARYCPRCGASIAYAPVGAAAGPPSWMPPTQRTASYPMRLRGIEGHVQTLGILWCVYAGYRLLHTIFGMLMLHTVIRHWGGWGGRWSDYGDAHMSFLTPLLPLFGILGVAWVGLAMFTGYSLLTRRPWGRTLAIVVAILTLIRVPLGTALAVYTLWALAPAASDAEYQALSQG
jgi:hypothetical protein